MRTCFVRAAAGLFAAISVAQAADMPDQEGRPFDVPPKEWKTYLATTDHFVRDKKNLAGPFAKFSNLERAKDGTLEARGLMLIHPQPAYWVAGTPSGAYYPPIREGDLIPGFNSQVCRVGSLEVPRRGDPATFTFSTVLNPPTGTALIKPTPGTTLRRGGWAVPIKQSRTDFGLVQSDVRSEHWRLWVDRVVASGKEPPTADLSLDLRSWPRLYTATVRKGDVLRYADHALRVVNVVPKDPKTRVIGWVEFDPKPLTADDAKKAVAGSGGKIVEARAARK